MDNYFLSLFFNISSLQIFLSFYLYIFLSSKMVFSVIISMLIRPSSAFSSKFFPPVSLRSKRTRFKKAELTKYWMRVGKRRSTEKKNNLLRIGKRKNWLRIGKRMVCRYDRLLVFLYSIIPT